MAGIYSTTRITGLSSGLDTDSLIKAAMTASQAKLDRLYQGKTSLEWKRDAYTDVRTKASEFSSKYFSALSSSNVFSKSAYKQFKVSVPDKYDSFFSVKGTSSAQNGNHTITKTQLAKSATISSANKVTNGVVSIDSATNANKVAQRTTGQELYTKDGKKLSELTAAERQKVKLDEIYTSATIRDDATKAFTSSGGKYVFSVGSSSKTGSTSATVDLTTSSDAPATFGEFMKEMSNKGNVNVGFDDTGKMTLSSKTLGSDSSVSFTGATKLTLGDSKMVNVADDLAKMTLEDMKTLKGDDIFSKDGKLSFEINGITFTTGTGSDDQDTDTVKIIGKDATMQDIADIVNKSGAKVDMTIDDQGFHIRSTDSQNPEISISNKEGKFFGGAGMEEDTGSITGLRAQTANQAQTLDRSKDTIANAAKKMGVADAVQNGVLSIMLQDKEGNMVKKEFAATKTLDQMMNEINADSSLGVKISYSQITDKFEFTSKETGSLSHVKIANDPTTDPKGDTLMSDAMKFFGFSETEAYGEDALIEIDGETIRRASNTFTLDGMEITIKDDWEADNAKYAVDGTTLGKAKIGVEQDIDATVNLMKDFVEAYNSMVDELYGMVNEQKDYDYEPLTQDQRDNMEDKDIEKWETEAKKGVLYRDSTISSYLSKMRQAMFEKLDGTKFSDINGSTGDTGLSAADIGFTTSKYVYGEYGGKIVFDEDTFRAALKKDPDMVANIMANVSESSDASTEYKESGFITKLFDTTSSFINTLRGTNIANVNTQITNYNDKMDDLIAKMYDEQERLYQQYAALETLMSQYQSQSTYLSNMLSALTA